jgi:hypothetical protein
MFGYITTQDLGVPNSDITSSTSEPSSAVQGFMADTEFASPCALAVEWPPVQLFPLVPIESPCGC